MLSLYADLYVAFFSQNDIFNNCSFASFQGSSSSMPHLLNSNMHNAQHSSAHTLSSELEGADSGDDYSGLLVDSVSNLTTMFFSSTNIVNRKNVDRNGAIKYCRIEQAVD